MQTTHGSAVPESDLYQHYMRFMRLVEIRIVSCNTPYILLLAVAKQGASRLSSS